MPVAPAAMPLPAEASSIATVLPMALLLLQLCLGCCGWVGTSTRQTRRRDWGNIHIPWKSCLSCLSVPRARVLHYLKREHAPSLLRVGHTDKHRQHQLHANRRRTVMSAVVGTAPALPINPADWSYLAEGGFHIILRYDGEDPHLSGRILRIGKKALGHQKEEDGKEPAAPAAAVVVPDAAGARRKFERGVLIPLLGEQYVQPGDAVTLSREDIGKIHFRYAYNGWVGCVLLRSGLSQRGVVAWAKTCPSVELVKFCVPCTHVSNTLNCGRWMVEYSQPSASTGQPALCFSTGDGTAVP